MSKKVKKKILGNKKILITGGAGFIGRNILESLGDKYDFLAPTKQELELMDQGAVFQYFKKNRVDLIIQSAAVGGFGREKEKGQGKILADNLRIFFNLIRAKEFYDKMIFFGSGAEYNKTRPLEKIKEEDFGQSIPSDEYGFYKYICSKYAEKTKYIVWLRLFGLYGKYEDYKYKFISNSIIKNLSKQDIVINQNVVFDHFFIDDLISVLDHFILNKPKFKSYNVIPDQSIDLITICNIINEISNYKSKIVVLNKGLNNEYTGDNSRLKNEISNLKFTNHKEGIEKLFKYYQENIEKIDKSAIFKDKYLKYCHINKK